MSEPDLAQERSLAANLDRRQTRSERSNAGASSSRSSELKAIGSSEATEDFSTIVTASQLKAAHQAESKEINQPPPGNFPDNEMGMRRRLRQLTQRVYHLERALDQSLAVNQELKQQVQTQQFLERQLATTEEFSNLQKREIDRLRQQLTQQQPQIVQDLEAELKNSWEKISSLEVQLQEACQQVTRLCENLTDRQATLIKSEHQLNQVKLELQEEKALVQAMQQEQTVNPPNQTVTKLLQELMNARSQIEYLETELSNQSQHSELMQQAYHELEQEHLNVRNGATVPDFPRIKELEHQVGQMQEQILAQAKQANEYEATIQHWKDRYLKKRSRAEQLKQLIQQVVPAPPRELLDLLAHLTMTDEEMLGTSGNVLDPNWDLDGRRKIDLPAFLTRRQKRFDRRG